MLLVGETALRQNDAREHHSQNSEDREGNENFNQRESWWYAPVSVCDAQHVVHKGVPEAGRVRTTVTESGLNSDAIGATTILIV